MNIENRIHADRNLFDHKDLTNHPLQLCVQLLVHCVHKMCSALPAQFIHCHEVCVCIRSIDSAEICASVGEVSQHVDLIFFQNKFSRAVHAHL